MTDGIGGFLAYLLDNLVDKLTDLEVELGVCTFFVKNFDPFYYGLDLVWGAALF
jgi:hypothetical protein